MLACVVLFMGWACFIWRYGLDSSCRVDVRDGGLGSRNGEVSTMLTSLIYLFNATTTPALNLDSQLEVRVPFSSAYLPTNASYNRSKYWRITWKPFVSQSVLIHAPRSTFMAQQHSSHSSSVVVPTKVFPTIDARSWHCQRAQPVDLSGLTVHAPTFFVLWCLY